VFVGPQELFSVFLVGFVIALPLYLLPVIIAVRRKHPNVTAIVLLDTLLGWTLIEWIVALIWAVAAFTRHPESRASVAPIPVSQYCSRCGTGLGSEAAFCPRCGAKCSPSG